MNIKKGQNLILDIYNRRKLTSTLHGSVLFPEVFGPLTQGGQGREFGGKRFKKWKRSRAVPRPEQSMRKINGSVAVGEVQVKLAQALPLGDSPNAKRSKDKV